MRSHIAITTFLSVALAYVSTATSANANIKACQGEEQNYEQIKKGASSIEINRAHGPRVTKGVSNSRGVFLTTAPR